MVKDVIAGLFMIFENQFSVGDYIQTEDATGTVEATAVRVTYLRSAKGDQIIIPNGSIERVINYTRGSYIATIVVSTAYEANTRQVMGLMEESGRPCGNTARPTRNSLRSCRWCGASTPLGSPAWISASPAR